MKKTGLLLLGALLTLLASTASAQPKRYLDRVFTNVKRTNSVVYGSNYTVLTISTLGRTFREPLLMDVYEPEGDTLAQRPLVLYFHTGNFLPWINPVTGLSVNQSCGGTRNDPAAVEICTRLAQMGYVVASVSYRLGWRPDLLDELQRRFTLINAAYRSIQDARTCIRFFRRDVALNNNQFRIDPNRIVLFGQGTGGYVTLNTAALDKYSEILNTSEPGKFIINNTPMVIEKYNGDPYGIQAAPGIVDAAYNAVTGFPVGDTLYVPNHVGYSSDFKLAVNLGGALGDKAWLDKNTPPILSFHVPQDPFAPCGDGLVIVPGVNFPVVNVTGSCGIQPIQDQLGNNAVFSLGGLLSDPISVFARTINGGREGFYPFLRAANDSSPWDWNRIIPNTQLPNGQVVPLNCNTDSVAARRVIDTIIAYYAPRACRALGLNCPGISVKAEEVFDASLVLTVFPNPATSGMWFSSDSEHPIQAIEVFDISGRMVRQVRGIEASTYVLQRDGLPDGIYVAKLYFPQGVAARRILFE
ncbi:MAG: T9SS type A sorting domain-containing protein [Saprospiraceae bacterium]|nr:T9SS type A sorting domain-containing protein [Saprospiraceae bacterium]MDW8230789.1 T9SS type A sorting domain-containing protein [Saprospiraceae bacterium]